MTNKGGQGGRGIRGDVGPLYMEKIDDVEKNAFRNHPSGFRHGIKQQGTERKAKALHWAVIPLAPFDNLRVFGFTPAGEPRLCVAYKIDEKDQKIEGYE